MAATPPICLYAIVMEFVLLLIHAVVVLDTVLISAISSSVMKYLKGNSLYAVAMVTAVVQSRVLVTKDTVVRIAKLFVIVLAMTLITSKSALNMDHVLAPDRL